MHADVFIFNQYFRDFGGKTLQKRKTLSTTTYCYYSLSVNISSLFRMVRQGNTVGSTRKWRKQGNAAKLITLSTRAAHTSRHNYRELQCFLVIKQTFEEYESIEKIS